MQTKKYQITYHLDGKISSAPFHPATNQPETPNCFKIDRGFIDVGIFLKNKFEYNDWPIGQDGREERKFDDADYNLYPSEKAINDPLIFGININRPLNSAMVPSGK